METTKPHIFGAQVRRAAARRHWGHRLYVATWWTGWWLVGVSFATAYLGFVGELAGWWQ